MDYSDSISWTTGSTTCLSRPIPSDENEGVTWNTISHTMCSWMRCKLPSQKCSHFELSYCNCRDKTNRSLNSRAGICLAILILLSCISQGVCHIRGSSGRRRGPYMEAEAYSWHTTPSPPQPLVDPTHSQDVTALAGRTALLNCRVHNINDKEVSWIRHRDIHLLTVGSYTYTSDQRFRGIHEDTSDDWLLKINYVQPRDSGIYECQVSTTPPLSQFIKLTVVEPKSIILGGPDMFINIGSTINLTCVVEFSPDPPEYMFWNHNEEVISYDSPRGGVTVIVEKGDITTSTLLIQGAKMSDSGRYDCTPSTAATANLTLHVLNGEHPAAIQHGGQGTYTSSSFRNIMALLLFTKALHIFMH